MSTVRTTSIGILYPGFSAEGDYFRMARMRVREIGVELVHTTVEEDAHREDALRRTGKLEHLVEGAETLKGQELAAAIWACNSASFVFGRQGDLDQCSALQKVLGVPVSSTSIAFVSALREMNVCRVAIAATNPEDVVRLFEEFLEIWDVETVHSDSLDILTGVEVAALLREDVVGLVRKCNHPKAQAILVPDTALHTAGFIDALEDAAGNKAVVTANQVTIWHPLRMVGFSLAGASPGLGKLFCDLETP